MGSTIWLNAAAVVAAVVGLVGDGDLAPWQGGELLVQACSTVRRLPDGEDLSHDQAAAGSLRWPSRALAHYCPET
jgi:hypothetical protein